MRVFICSPYRGDWSGYEGESPDLERHIYYAADLCGAVMESGGVTDIECPHIFYPLFFTGTRDAALALALSRLETCDVLLVGEKYGISTGMKGEIEAAAAVDMPIVVVRETAEVAEALVALRSL